MYDVKLWPTFELQVSEDKWLQIETEKIQTDKYTVRQTGKKKNQRDSQTYRQTNRQIGKQIDKQT